MNADTMNKVNEYLYAIVNTAEVETTISRHRTERAARMAFRKRNPWLHNSRWAQDHGMQHSGTFDEIREI